MQETPTPPESSSPETGNFPPKDNQGPKAAGGGSRFPWGKPASPVEEQQPASQEPKLLEPGAATDKKGRPLKKPISRPRRVFRWALVFAILFGLGALTVALAVVIPMQRLQAGESSQLQAANARIGELQATIDSYAPLGNENKGLQSNLDQAGQEIALLRARADVATAQLALAKKDPAKARVALNQTPATLDQLASLLQPEGRQVVTDMKNRLSLALSEIDSNAYAAESDLDVLMAALLQLESSLLR